MANLRMTGGGSMKYLFWNKSLFLCLASLFVQQLIATSSTLWIARLSEALISEKPFTLYLILFIISLIVVYFPYISATMYYEKAKFDAVHSYVSRFADLYKGAQKFSKDSEFRKNQEPWLTNENYLVVEEATSFVYYCGSSIIGVVLNVIALGSIIDARLALGYFISFLILILALRICNKSLAGASSEFQQHRKSMSQTLLSAWEDIFVGDAYNFRLWKNRFFTSWRSARGASIKAGVLTQLFSAMTMVLVSLPVFFIIVWLFYQNMGNYPILAALTVTLPRQMQMLQDIYLIASYAMQWSGLQAKLQGLMGSLTPFDREEPENSCRVIDWQSIRVEELGEIQNVDSLDAMLSLISKQGAKRITIHGNEASNKSYLLSLLKEHLAEQAFYWSNPQEDDIVIDEDSDKSLASKLLDCLKFLRGSATFPVVLLEEWDAYMDEACTLNLSLEIDLLAQNCQVVELRHHSG